MDDVEVLPNQQHRGASGTLMEMHPTVAFFYGTLECEKQTQRLRVSEGVVDPAG